MRADVGRAVYTACDGCNRTAIPALPPSLGQASGRRRRLGVRAGGCRLGVGHARYRSVLPGWLGDVSSSWGGVILRSLHPVLRFWLINSRPLSTRIMDGRKAAAFLQFLKHSDDAASR